MMGKMKGLGLLLGLALVLSPAAVLPAGACVGKTLTIGSAGTLQQDILAQMISILIEERTGTTAKVVSFDSAAAAHEALTKADLDLCVEYTGVGQVQILHGEPIADSAALYEAVKAKYNQELNLVWLKPLGFEEPKAIEGVPAQAAPVARKDTLKKFPALARLINKLGGAIDAASMKDLEARAGQKSPREAAREFLKTNRLI